MFVVGCLDGIDVHVTRTDAGVTLKREDAEFTVPERAWRTAVVSFADAVLTFYALQPPRNPIEDAEDRKGWQAFWQEYHERLDRHRIASTHGASTDTER